MVFFKVAHFKIVILNGSVNTVSLVGGHWSITPLNGISCSFDANIKILFVRTILQVFSNIVCCESKLEVGFHQAISLYKVTHIMSLA